MIQRIQTLYLGVAAVMMIVAASTLSAIGAENHAVVMAGTIIAAVLAAVSLGTVFLFSDRVRQRKIVRAISSGGILVLLDVGLVYWTSRGTAVAESQTNGLLIATIATVVALGLLHLASKAIKKDIDLVKSMDRIR